VSAQTPPPIDPLSEARRLLAAKDEPTRLKGVQRLRDRTPDRTAAARLLVKTLRDPGTYVPHAARVALTSLGASAHQVLFEALRGNDDDVRIHSLWALADDQGPDAEIVARRVTGCSADQAPMVRHAVAGALGRIGGSGRFIEVADAALSALAGDREPTVRAEAIESLALRDRSLGQTFDVVLAALDDGAGTVRVAAATALTGAVPTSVSAARVREALGEECYEPARLALAGLSERWEAQL